MTSTFVDAAQSCLTNSLSHYPKNPEGLQMAHLRSKSNVGSRGEHQTFL